jgi:hypothetical protein
MMMAIPAEDAERVRIDGFVPRALMIERLGIADHDWRSFAATWDDLGPDEYMADGGRYRRRRFGVMALRSGGLEPQPHQPHFQARDYNRLNGGVDRWFEPIIPAVLAHPVIARLVALSREMFGLDGSASGPTPGWRVELHQFRIEARNGSVGLPTPEGVHRDGVDWVAVMLVARVNVERGVTAIFDERLRPLGAFTLTAPMDAVFLDDHRVLHGVTPIAAVDPEAPAWRDVLVMTFTRTPDR